MNKTERKIMNIITDFEAWLDGVSPEDHEEIYSLYSSVANCEEWGLYKTVQANGSTNRWIVTCSTNEDGLRLASEKAKNAFLKHIVDKFCDGEDIETWYGFKHAMAKDD